MADPNAPPEPGIMGPWDAEDQALTDGDWKGAESAEKRLAKATALLERCLDEIDCDIYDDPCTQQLVADGRSFLSRAPAQPAPAAPWAVPLEGPGSHEADLEALRGEQAANRALEQAIDAAVKELEQICGDVQPVKSALSALRSARGGGK